MRLKDTAASVAAKERPRLVEDEDGILYASVYRIIHLLRIPISLVSPFLFLVLLIKNSANTIDITAINAAVRNVRSYDSGDGNEAEILFDSGSMITWFACRNDPAITGPTM